MTGPAPAFRRAALGCAVGTALLLAGCADGGPAAHAPTAVDPVAPFTAPAAASTVPPSDPPTVDPAAGPSSPDAGRPSAVTAAPVPASSVPPATPPSTAPPATPATGTTGTPAPTPAATEPAANERAGAALPASAPLRLSVPAIGIDSPLVDLGRNPDGTVEVPSLDDPHARPGWYRGSPTPGAPGPAIILGHVDSRRFGPGVFYHLAELRPGDTVDVARADGTVARFAVDEVRQVDKREFPTLEVYGNLDHAGLRLITCGGEFDPAAGSYESNVIVFASLAGAG